HAEFLSKGEALNPDDVLRDLRVRDEGDEARAIAPMKPADDAHVIDTTTMDLDQVLVWIEADVRAHRAADSGLSA
ncbi:(d)CMP kinase, partial [Singulisphaera rosea]